MGPGIERRKRKTYALDHTATGIDPIIIGVIKLRTVGWMWRPRVYKGADKSLARPASSCILIDGENISSDASLYIYIYSSNNDYK